MPIRKQIGFLLVLLMSASLSAEVLKRIDPTLSDYATLLKSAGYELYAYDISGLVDDTYNVECIIREYSGDTLISKNVLSFPVIMKNRYMVTDFDEEDQKTMKPEVMYDAAKGIYKAAEKFTLGFLPKTDNKDGGKEITAIFEIPHIGARYAYLNLRPQSAPGSTNQFYAYNTREFKSTEWKENEFIPLLLLGSVWFDEKFNVFRFCGEEELLPDMSSSMIKYIPHFYVIGVTITKKQK